MGNFIDIVVTHKKKIIAAVLLAVGTYLSGGDIHAAIAFFKPLLKLFGG